MPMMVVPQVLLADENTASDGDIIAHSFQQLNVGPVVGTRTWGGVLCVADETELVDGTSVSHPSRGVYLTGAGMSLENRGVSPNHEIMKRPEEFQDGVDDPQLVKAVAVAVENLKSKCQEETPPSSRGLVWSAPS